MATLIEAPTELQKQLAGKVDQLSADPAKACRTGHTETATPESPLEAQPESGEDDQPAKQSLVWLTLPMPILAIALGAILMTVIVLAYVCFGGRQFGLRNAAYSLVPVTDMENETK